MCRTVVRAVLPFLSWVGAVGQPSDVGDSLLLTGFFDYRKSETRLYYLGTSSDPGNLQLITKWDYRHVSDGRIYLYETGSNPDGRSVYYYPRTEDVDPPFFEYFPPISGIPYTAEIFLSEANTYRGYHRFYPYEPDSNVYSGTFKKLDEQGGQAQLTSIAGARYELYTHKPTSGAQNVSNHVILYPGDIAITGFVVDERRWVLVRGVGPSLSAFGVEDPVDDPVTSLFRGEKLIAANQRWGEAGPDSVGFGTVFELAGAFPLDEESADSALFLLVDPGQYTVHVSGPGMTEPGSLLVEVYLLPYGQE